MATFKRPDFETFKAASIIPANHLVKLVAVDTVALCSVAGEKAIGVSYSEATEVDQAVEVVTSGGAKLKLAEAVTPMKFLGPNAQGQGQLSNAGEFSVCQALEVGAVGDIISVGISPINIIASE